jgi:outer membrane lipase/esterase
MKSSKWNGSRRIALLAGAFVSALLASCGGGQQVQSFTAKRVFAFGDETSVINANGSKYTVNGLASGSTATLDCAVNPIWIQSVAGIYGLVFPQCNPGGASDPTSRIYAANGAQVADLPAQIDQQVAEGGFTNADLATVLVGPNDVLAQFAQYPAIGEDQLLVNVDAAGAALAAQVNRLAALGAKVIVSTMPDMGRTPFAGDRSVGSTNGNPGVLSRLSTRFNDSLLSHLTNDGHQIGLVQLDEYLTLVDRATQSSTNATFANTTLASCQATAPLPLCSTNTLVSEAVGVSWLWADDRHLSSSGQASLASLAVTRAQNNPF